MIRGIVYSRRLSALSTACVGAAFGMALFRHHLTRETTELRRRTADLEGTFTRQIAAKSDFEDSMLDALRVRVGKFRGQLGPEDTWEQLVRQFGKRWEIEAGPRDERDGYSLQVGTFLLLSPTPSDWPRIVEAVEAAEKFQGVGIAAFEMKSSGSREHRAVDLVRIVVAIHTRRA